MDLFQLVKSFAKARGDRNLSLYIESNFDYYRHRTLAHILENIRLALGYSFEGEPKYHPAKEISELRSEFDSYAIHFKILLDQIANLIYLFYTGLDKEWNFKKHIQNSTYHLSISSLRQALRENPGVDDNLLQLLDNHWIWIEELLGVSNRLVHEFYYSDVYYDQKTEECRVVLYGKEPLYINSLMSFVALSCYCYSLFIKDCTSHFVGLLNNDLEKLNIEKGLGKMDETNFCPPLNFFINEGANRFMQFSIKLDKKDIPKVLKTLKTLLVDITPQPCGCTPDVKVTTHPNKTGTVVFTASCRHRPIWPISFDIQNIILFDFIEYYLKDYEFSRELRENAINKLLKKRSV